MIDLEELSRRLTESDPFGSDRVGEEGRGFEYDVVEVHNRPFERLCRSAARVTAERTSRGIMLLGDPGVGKSHLIARLSHWVDHSDPGATAVFLYNILVAPERVPRHILAASVGALSGGRTGDGYADCRLYELWQAAVRTGAKLPSDAEITLEHAEMAIEALAGTADVLDRAIRLVLLKVGLNMHRAHHEQDNFNKPLLEAGLSWLSGEHLDEEVSARLGLEDNGDVGQGLRDDQDIVQVFRVLADLSSLSKRPFIICIDQFDNLSEDQIRACARFFHTILDVIPNLACILSGVTANVLPLKERGIITVANWDRVAQDEITLRGLRPELAHRIVLPRLKEFQQPFLDLPEVRLAAQREPYFPLRREFFDDKIGDAVSVRPRQMIRWASAAWADEADQCAEKGINRWIADFNSTPSTAAEPARKQSVIARTEKLIDRAVDQRRTSSFQVRKRNPHTLPASGANLEGLLRVLLHFAALHEGFAVTQVTDGDKGYNLKVHSKGDKMVAVAFIVEASAARSTVALRRLCDVRPADAPKLLLVEDKRRLISMTDTATKYLNNLRGRPGFSHVQITFHDHARLDALASTLLSGRAGDIEIEELGNPRTVFEQEIFDSFVRSGALREVPMLWDLIEPV